MSLKLATAHQRLLEEARRPRCGSHPVRMPLKFLPHSRSPAHDASEALGVADMGWPASRPVPTFVRRSNAGRQGMCADVRALDCPTSSACNRAFGGFMIDSRLLFSAFVGVLCLVLIVAAATTVRILSQ